MRLGQKNGCVRQWAKRGTRPRQPADQRYQNTYIFGAVCPARDTGAALILPTANTEAMQLHLDEIALSVAPGAHALLLLDNAGWHRTRKLFWPPNITPVFLPPGSCPWSWCSRAVMSRDRCWLGSHAQAAAMRLGLACGSSLNWASFSRLM